MSREAIDSAKKIVDNLGIGGDYLEQEEDAIKGITQEIEGLLAAEREKVREMCAEYLEKEAAKCADSADEEAGEARAAWNREESWYEDSADAIRQLDLTRLDEGSQGKLDG